MTKVYIADTTQSITVDEAVYTVQVASAASDTTVSTSGSGNSLIASSTGGAHVLKSLASGTNITLTDDGNTITVSSTDTEDDLSNNDTDDLSEGSTNQYFTDARVMTALETVSGHVIPSANVTYDLGSTTHMWRDAYIGPGSLYINGQKIISSDTGEINITTDPNENLNIQAGGDITVLSAGLTTNIQDTTVNLGPSTNNGTTNIRGTLDVVTKIEMGDLDLTSGQIHQDSTNGDLTLKTNGTGKVIADTSNLVVGTLAGDNTQITPTGITGDVTGTVSSIANHNTGDLTEGSNLYYTDARADARVNLQTGANLDLSNKSTTNLTEGSNLYYTDARADARAQIKIDALVDSAPGTLDTLNELAAALGDDANFSTTVTNSIATKWTQDNTKISNWDTAYSWGDHSTAGYLTSFTETNDLSSAVTWANVPDANITQSSVTQHQAALSITESQISDLTHYTDTDARTAISLTTDSTSLTYNSTTGAFVYTDPTGEPGPANRIQIDVRNQTGSTITAGSAVYISGVSGNNQLITLADADGTNPAMGIVVSDISNNSNGIIVTNGEVTGFDTSAYAVNDTLYLSPTAGELTTTRPSLSSQIVQNIARVVKVHAQTGIIVVQGSGRANDVPNLDSGQVFIGNGTGYDKRALTTSDVSEGTNEYFTSARAISAVEGEATLDLTGALTVDGQISTDSVIKVDDGFLLTSFNPYGAGNTMNTTIMGVGKEGGWAGVAVRNRGQHDFGIGSQYNLAPRALLALQAGLLDGSSNDTELTDGMEFGVVSGMPYSGYRTGTEWLTPSTEIGFVATQDHSESNGFGTKIAFHSTANGGKAGQFDTSHFTDTIYFQDTTITTTDTLKIDDDLEITGTLQIDGSISATDNVVDFADNVKVTGSTSDKTTVVGDATIGPYGSHGVKVDAGDTSWGNFLIKEYVGSSGKPITSFTNPTFGTEIVGGTVASPAQVPSGKRLWVAQALASNETDGTIPSTSNFRIMAQTTQEQTTANRGTELLFESTADDANATTTTMKLQGNVVTLNTGGNATLETGGDLTINDDVDVTGTLDVTGNATFDGNVTLGNANDDQITVTGALNVQNGFNLPQMNTATAQYLDSIGVPQTADMAFISDGDSGNPCIAVFSNGDWLRISLGSAISSS